MAEAKKTKTTKTTEQAAVKEAAPTTAAKKTTVKKTETKAAVKKTTTRTKKAAAVKASISIQFAGKEYSTEQLVKIAKDVWEFDLAKNPADFKEVQLYVKPEEAKAYYVINGAESGSFDI